MYSNISARVVLRNRVSGQIPLYESVRQGCFAQPTVFRLCKDHLKNFPNTEFAGADLKAYIFLGS